MTLMIMPMNEDTTDATITNEKKWQMMLLAPTNKWSQWQNLQQSRYCGWKTLQLSLPPTKKEAATPTIRINKICSYHKQKSCNLYQMGWTRPLNHWLRPMKQLLPQHPANKTNECVTAVATTNKATTTGERISLSTAIPISNKHIHN